MTTPAPGKRIGLRHAPRTGPKPGATTLQPTTATSLVAVYLQVLRIGTAAHDRLTRLLPALSGAVAVPMVELDARRALRELDDALASTEVVTAPIARAIADRRDALAAKRDALPADVRGRLARAA